MNCPRCGKQVAEGAAFCGACGAAMSPPTQQPAAKGASYWIIGGVALLLVVVVGVGGFFGARWWRSRSDAPPAPITQTEQGNELAIVEPEAGTTTPSDEPDNDEGGVHLDDEDIARQLVMDFFSMWSEGDEEGITDTLTPATLVGAKDYDFDSPYEQFSVEIILAREAWAGTWRFVVVETYDAGDGERARTEYEVAVSKSQGEFMVSSIRTFEDSGDSGEDDEQADDGDDDASYYSSLMPVYLFFRGWRDGDPEQVRMQMTEELAAETGDDPFATGYEQVDLEVLESAQTGQDVWTYVLLETFKSPDADATLEARYKFRVVRTTEGWRISEWEALETE